MIRAFLLGLCWCGIIGLSQGTDAFSEELACEDTTPDHIYLDLSEMDIQIIRKPIATSPTITCLNLAGNKIRHIASNAFVGLPELHYLNLADNPISYHDLAESKLPKLRTLILDAPLIADNSNDQEEPFNENQDEIRGIDPGESPVIRFLRIRQMKNRHVYSDDLNEGNYDGIPDNQNEENTPTISLPQLEKLSLQYLHEENQNRIRYWFKILNIPNLTHLYLAGNNIRSDDFMDVLSKLNNLTHLHLDVNELHDLIGVSLFNLRYLSMNQNSIQALGTDNNYRYISTMIPRGMFNLEYLSLMNNGIEHIGLDAFETSENLRFLNLAENKIGDFSSNVLSYLINLRNLTLDKNLLTSVPPICELHQLRTLSLNGNKIKSINQTSFCNLRQLSAIYLKHNGLNIIEDETFGHLTALRVLDLSANNIVSLPEYWIAPHNFIVELHLDGNGFMTIESMSLKKIHGLQSLSFGHNPLKRVTLLSMMDLPNSTTIDVSREIRSTLFNL